MSYSSEDFANYADLIGLSSPALVEKDYYVVEMLRAIQDYSHSDVEVVFGGGTSIAKMVSNIDRMSEDVDIKLAFKPSDEVRSRGQEKRILKEVGSDLLELITQENLSLSDSKKRNEYKYQIYEITYPQDQGQDSALRSNIKLELSNTPLFGQEPIAYPIDSLIAKYSRSSSGVTMLCSNLELTAAEKLISLLRKTAASRFEGADDDLTLVRHAYDLFVLDEENSVSWSNVNSIAREVLDYDAEKFRRQIPELGIDPTNELQVGLGMLNNNEYFQKRYDDFLKPLVFRVDPPTWMESLGLINTLSRQLISPSTLLKP